VPVDTTTLAAGAELTDLTGQVTDFVAGLTYGDLPSTVVASAKLFTLECIGHMVAGLRQPVGRLVAGYVRDMEAKAEASVLGGGFRTTIAEAAYANGTTAHADELEAYGTVAGTGLVPPIAAGLAVGEWLDRSGSDYLVALVAGVEMQGRLGLAGPGAPDRGFMGFSLVGPAGAGVTAGRLLDLSPTQLRHTIGVALPLGGGSLRGCGYMAHVHEAGVPARTGVWAASLVSKGFTGCPDYLDGAFSWGEQFAAGGRGYHPERLTENLGAGFFLDSPGSAPKLYGSCGATHQSVEGLIRLIEEQVLAVDDIAAVRLLVPPFAARVAGFEEPQTAEQAKFSIVHSVAGILVEGVPELPYMAAFTDEAATDPRYVAARRRVELVIDGSRPNVRGFDAQSVEVRLTDGRSFSTTVEGLEVRGRDVNPLSVDERIDLFRNTVRPSVDKATAEQVIDIVMDCEQHSIGEIGRVLVTHD
jgi:2-methylcitrate dehydratase PrpD